MLRCALLLLLVVIGCTRGGSPRLNPFAYSARDCRSAAALLAPGREATPHMAPQLWRVRACPIRAGELLAAIVQESRAITDTSVLEARTWLTHYVHDAHLLAAGIEVASDSRAAPEARITAFRVLLWSKAPGHHMSLRAMIEGPNCVPGRCRSSYTGHFYHGMVVGDTTSWPIFGTPMPPGYVARIDSVARSVESAPSTPRRVRQAAQIVRQFPPDPELNGR